jgi:hypothetical protein
MSANNKPKWKNYNAKQWSPEGHRYDEASPIIWGPSTGNDSQEEELEKPFFVWSSIKDWRNDWNYNRYPKWNHPDYRAGPPYYIDGKVHLKHTMLMKANWPKKARASFETLGDAIQFADLIVN